MLDGKSERHVEKSGDHLEDVGGVAEAVGDLLLVGASDGGYLVGIRNDEAEDGKLPPIRLRIRPLLHRIDARDLVDQLFSAGG